jgi:hypothetical protein
MSLQPSQSTGPASIENGPTDNGQTDNEPTDNEARAAEPAENEGRSFTTGIGSMVAPAKDDRVVNSPVVDNPVVDSPVANNPVANNTGAPALRPTFTARSSEPTTVTPVPEPAPAPDDTPAPDDRTLSAPRTVPAARTVAQSTAPAQPAIGPDDGADKENTRTPGAAPDAGPAGGPRMAWADRDRTRSQPLPAMAGLDEPLLGDVAGLRARWQQVQTGFVDDPHEAVGDAADLVEQTAQALVGALRQRQRRLRMLWDGGPADGTGAANGEPVSAQAAGLPDTEHLRLMMQRYRALFNQLCRP